MTALYISNRGLNNGIQPGELTLQHITSEKEKFRGYEHLTLLPSGGLYAASGQGFQAVCQSTIAHHLTLHHPAVSQKYFRARVSSRKFQRRMSEK